MSRAKYKLGTMVQYGAEGEMQDTGVVGAIVTRATGHSYILNNVVGEINENDITAAYRQVTPRNTKKTVAKKSTTKKNNKTTETMTTAAN